MTVTLLEHFAGLSSGLCIAWLLRLCNCLCLWLQLFCTQTLGEGFWSAGQQRNICLCAWRLSFFFFFIIVFVWLCSPECVSFLVKALYGETVHARVTGYSQSVEALNFFSRGPLIFCFKKTYLWAENLQNKLSVSRSIDRSINCSIIQSVDQSISFSSTNLVARLEWNRRISISIEPCTGFLLWIWTSCFHSV